MKKIAINSSGWIVSALDHLLYYVQWWWRSGNCEQSSMFPVIRFDMIVARFRWIFFLVPCAFLVDCTISNVSIAVLILLESHWNGYRWWYMLAAQRFNHSLWVRWGLGSDEVGLCLFSIATLLQYCVQLKRWISTTQASIRMQANWSGRPISWEGIVLSDKR